MSRPLSERQSLEQELAELPGRIAADRQELAAEELGAPVRFVPVLGEAR